ncbi:MAG: hypothetical protein UY05_C0005G0005 [Candidatus Peregrinibacteria bacterium GW2011_GWA2_47_7]|nr:MAG: hypothetical protein UY05_C0005G0005 [Candidatus Peregrinibacteria bacterium GW2011_GWA2_47_7]
MENRSSYNKGHAGHAMNRNPFFYQKSKISNHHDMRQKHFYIGGGFLVALVTAALAVTTATSQAQSVNCNYESLWGPSIFSVVIEVGQTTASNAFVVQTSGTQCAGDQVSVQLWDTPNQREWPTSECTISPTTMSGSNANPVLTVSCTKPISRSYDPLIRVLRGGQVVNTYVMELKPESYGYSLTPTSNTTFGDLAVGATKTYPFSIGEVDENGVRGDNLTIEVREDNAVSTFCKPAEPSMYHLGYGTSVITNITCTPTSANVGTHELMLRVKSQKNEQAGMHPYNSTLFTINVPSPLKANGASCTTGNSECSSGLCTLGKCSPGYANDASCTSNYECKSAICTNGKCSVSATSGCASGQVSCMDSANRQVCITGSTCPSTLCASDTIKCKNANGNEYCYGGTTCPSCALGQTVCYYMNGGPSYCYSGTTCPANAVDPNATTNITSCPGGQARCYTTANPPTPYCYAGAACPDNVTNLCSYTRPTNPTQTSCAAAIDAFMSCGGGAGGSRQSMIDGCLGSTSSCIYNQPTSPTRQTCEASADAYLSCSGGIGSRQAMIDACMGSTTTTPSCSSGQMLCYDSTGKSYCNTGTSCPSPNTGSYCGDNMCSSSESYTSCPADCGDGTRGSMTVQPGEKKARTSGTGSYYCAGDSNTPGGMTFYSQTHVYCAKAPAVSGGGQWQMYSMWTGADVKKVLTELGSGWSVCRPEDGSCLEPDETGPSSSWCGWYPPNAGGSMMYYNEKGQRVCPGLDSAGPIIIDDPLRPVGPVCNQVQTWFQDTQTGKCYYTPTSCGVPLGAKSTNDSSARCKALGFEKPEAVNEPMTPIFVGPPIDINIDPDKEITDPFQCKERLSGIGEELRGLRSTLKQTRRDIERSQSGEAVLNNLINRGLELSDKVNATLKQGKCEKTTMTDLNTLMSELRGEVMPAIWEQQKVLSAYAEFRFLIEELERRVSDIERQSKEMRRHNKTASEQLDKKAQEIAALIDRVKKAQSTYDVIELDDVKDAMWALEEEVGEIFANVGRDNTGQYVRQRIESIRDTLDEVQEEVADKNVVDETLNTLIAKANASLDEAEDLLARGREGEAGRILERLDELRRPIENLLEKYGIEVEEEEHDYEVIFEGRFEQELVDKITARIEQVVQEKVSLFVDAAVQSLAAKMAEIEVVVNEKIQQSLSNMLAIVNDEVRNEIIANQEQLLTQIQELENQSKKLTSAIVKRDLEKAVERLTVVTWCGDNSQALRTRANGLLEALTAGDADEDEIHTFLTDVERYERDNQSKCYEDGASPYKDFPMWDAWYYEDAVYNHGAGYIVGRTDNQGRQTGEFDPGRATLCGEALAIGMRVFEVPLGPPEVVPADATGAAPWMYPYVNGARSTGANIPCGALNQPISRMEAAQLFVDLGGNRFPTVTATPNAAAFSDYSQFRSNAEGSAAIEAFASADIYQGTPEGMVKPFDPLRRSEFAAVTKRMVNNLGLE